jgi:hypothetical protein
LEPKFSDILEVEAGLVPARIVRQVILLCKIRALDLPCPYSVSSIFKTSKYLISNEHQSALLAHHRQTEACATSNRNLAANR